MIEQQYDTCQQRGLNNVWENVLPRQVQTSHGTNLELSILCPGDQCCNCVGDAWQIVDLVSRLDNEALRMRYFVFPKRTSLQALELKTLRKQRVLIGAYIGPELVGMIYVADGELTELAFVTDPCHANNGIATILLTTALDALKKIDGAVHVHIMALKENTAMCTALAHHPAMQRLPQDIEDWTIANFEYTS